MELLLYFLMFLFSHRYESVIIPREEGKLVFDSPKKKKKANPPYKLPIQVRLLEFLVILYLSSLRSTNSSYEVVKFWETVGNLGT